MQTHRDCGSVGYTHDEEVRMRARTRWEAIPFILLIVGTLVLVAPAAQTQAPKPDFSGKWELDIEKSDDAVLVIRGALGQTGGRSRDQEQRRLLSSRLNYLARAGETIEIEQTEKDFKLFNSEDDVRIYYIDGEKHPRQSPTGAKMTTVTVWREALLGVTTEGDEIGKAAETFGLEGFQLVHIVRIQNKAFEEDLLLRSYYNRLED